MPRKQRSINKGLSRSELSSIIDEWIFSERNRRILKRRLLDGITLEKLAEEFDMSVRQVRNIIYLNIDTINEHL